MGGTGALLARAVLLTWMLPCICRGGYSVSHVDQYGGAASQAKHPSCILLCCLSSDDSGSSPRSYALGGVTDSDPKAVTRCCVRKEWALGGSGMECRRG